MPGRFIGIKHGVKRTVEGESRPTVVAILSEDGTIDRVELPDEESEIAFLQGTYRPKDAEKRTPSIGMEGGDTLATLVEGLAGEFAAGAARIGKERGFNVVRIPGYWLKQHRSRFEGTVEDDPAILALLATQDPGLFFPVGLRDLAMVDLAALVMERQDTMKSRRSAMLRLTARVRRGRYRKLGLTTVGSLKEAIEKARAADSTIAVLEMEEKDLVAQIEGQLGAFPQYAEIFKLIDGIGPVGAAELIVAIQDIRRFSTDGKLRAYLGMHTRAGVIAVRDGKRIITVPDHPKFSLALPREVTLPEGAAYRFFPRHLKGLPGNWNDLGRQALIRFKDYHWQKWWLDVEDPKRRTFRSSWTRLLDRTYARMLTSDRWKPLLDAADATERRYLETRIRQHASYRFLQNFVRHVFNKWWRLERSGRLAAEE